MSWGGDMERGGGMALGRLRGSWGSPVPPPHCHGPPRAGDMWRLGCLIWEVFNGPLPRPGALRSFGKVRDAPPKKILGTPWAPPTTLDPPQTPTSLGVPLSMSCPLTRCPLCPLSCPPG